MSTRPIGPVALENAHVRLQPLRSEHADGVLAAAADHDIWAWMAYPLADAAAVARFVDEAAAAEHAGTEFTFAVRVAGDGRIVGSTRYMDIQSAHRGVEIGWTWYTPDVWGGVVNPAAKRLLLAHAFETWGAIRVMLKTDARNLHSQAAIRKLGGVYEGTLRQHRIRPDGTYRDTVVFSILDHEWPGVRARLDKRLGSAADG